MITADCGCNVVAGEDCPIVNLVCDPHVGMEIYNDYDGSVAKFCDELIDKFQHRKTSGGKS